MKRIVIIGFGSAGLTAAATTRAVNPTAKITVLERRPYATYHPCDIPFAIGGEVPDIKKLIEPAPSLPNVEVRTATEARAIDKGARRVEFKELRTEKRGTIEYDALILATGSYPFVPPIPGVDLGGVFAIKTVEDGQAVIGELGKAKKAAVVGAGPIGLETAVALRNRGLEVTLVEMFPSILPNMLDPDMASQVVERLTEKGVEVMCGQTVEKISGDRRPTSISVGGKELPADLVILATGVKPEVRLAKEAGIELGETGGIKVDERMLTNTQDIYAAGDCAEAFCMITKRPMLSQLSTTAILMGRVAGTNAAGGEAKFEGTLNTTVTSAYGLEIASTGLTMEVARRAGMDPIVGRIRTLDRSRFYPGGKPITVKLLVEPKKHRLIGGQILASDGAAERANLLALAIKRGMTVKELSRIEYCYAPPVCDVIEPLVMAAEAVLRKL